MNVKNIYGTEEIKHAILHLKREFKSLFERVNIDEYSFKLAENASVIVAIENDKIIGFLSLYLNDNISNIAYITLIGVSLDYQNQGYGSKLLNYAIKLAKSNDMKYIKLEVDNSNRQAKNFYFKNGFVLDSFSARDSSFLIKSII